MINKDYDVRIAPVFYQAFNEDGPYTAKAYTVEAADADGHIWIHHRQDLTEDQAAQLVERIGQAIFNGREFTPHASDYWLFSRRAYGSASYVANQIEEEHDRQKADVENEYGPGAYQPHHPGYLGRH